MDFLVVGCGSIGQRHLRNLKSLGHQVSGCEENLSRGKQVAKKYNIRVFSSLKEALQEKYDGAFVCTPTSLHVPMSIDIANKGINLFIEKPLSNSMERIAELERIAKKRSLTTMVGCNVRFLPSFRLAKSLIKKNAIGKILSVKAECGFYLPYWHPYEDYRGSYSANKKLGGGVIFDDIHELDALNYLFGNAKEIFCFADKISDLDIDTEDVAEIFLKFDSGVIAQVHLDYLQRTYRKYYEFIGEKGVILWDYITQSVELYTEKTNQRKVYQENINTNREIMFIEEIKHFIDCITRRQRSINDIQSARGILEMALACHESSRKKKGVCL